MVSENVFGNGYSLAITDGTNLGTIINVSVGNSRGYAVGTKNGLGYKNGSGTGGWGLSDVRVGVPTKNQLSSSSLAFSGLIVDTVTVYSWKKTA